MQHNVLWCCPRVRRDTPDPYGGGRKNYVIDAPGRYRLKSGRVTRLG